MSIPIDNYLKQLQFVETGTGAILGFTGQGSNITPKELYPDTISLNSMIDDMIRRLVSIKNKVKENRINLMVPTIAPVNTATNSGKDNVTVTNAATIYDPAMNTTSEDIWDVQTNRGEVAGADAKNPKIYKEFSESALFMYLRQSAYTINVVENAPNLTQFNKAFPDKDATTPTANGTVPIPGPKA